MGRIKKYTTKETKLESRNVASKKYYWANKEKCDKEARERYQKKQKNE